MDIDRDIFKKQDTIKRDTRRKVGITLPLSDKNGRLFQQSSTTDEQVYSNLVNLLLTQRGERFMHSNFGTDLLKIVFEPMNNDLVEKISADINASVAFWLPYVNVQVDVNPATEDDIYNGHLLSIRVDYYINGREANKPIIIYVTQIGTLITG